MLRLVFLGLFVVGTASVAFAGGTPAAPEIDPGQAMSALALLSGAILIVRSRRRGK